MKNLGLVVPFYVTRVTASGETGAFYMNAWLAIFCFFLMWMNFLIWNIVALIAAFKVVL